MQAIQGDGIACATDPLTRTSCRVNAHSWDESQCHWTIKPVATKCYVAHGIDDDADDYGHPRLYSRVIFDELALWQQPTAEHACCAGVSKPAEHRRHFVLLIPKMCTS